MEQNNTAIYRIKNVSERNYNPFMCVVYSSHANVEGVQDIGTLPYARRGSELSKPYIRCDPSILVYQESLLNRIIGPQEVYKTV